MTNIESLTAGGDHRKLWRPPQLWCETKIVTFQNDFVYDTNKPTSQQIFIFKASWHPVSCASDMTSDVGNLCGLCYSRILTTRCSPDTEGRCFCRSRTPRCSSGRGRTLSSSRGSRGRWPGRGPTSARRPGSGDRGWRTAPSPSWWGWSGLLASSRTLSVFWQNCAMFWPRIWGRLTQAAWEQPGLCQHTSQQPRPSQCASRGVVLCYTLGHHKIYLKWVQKLIKLIRLKRLISYKLRCNDAFYQNSYIVCIFWHPELNCWIHDTSFCTEAWWWWRLRCDVYFRGQCIHTSEAKYFMIPVKLYLGF